MANLSPIQLSSFQKDIMTTARAIIIIIIIIIHPGNCTRKLYKEGQGVSRSVKGSGNLNLAVENGPFIDDLSVHDSGFSVLAMFWLTVDSVKHASGVQSGQRPRQKHRGGTIKIGKRRPKSGYPFGLSVSGYPLVI